MSATEPVVTCDGCGKDLTVTGNCQDYRLVLGNQSIPPRRGFVTAMHIPPPIDGAKHFCRLKCLDDWRSRELAEAAAREAHRVNLGHGLYRMTGAYEPVEEKAAPIPKDERGQ